MAKLVIIAGMHRSGTSLVCRLLNLCGMALGDPDDLMPPAPDNPEGFWENRRFLELNDAVLRANGEAWDWAKATGPALTGPALEQLRPAAERLAQGFAEGPFRGWKDPRNSLTLRFWRSVVPEAHVVLVVRHPQEVARSLERRNHLSSTLALNLWFVYNARVIEAIEPPRLVVTHFDSYFDAPEVELARVLGQLNVQASRERLKQACASVSPGNCRARLTPSERRAEAPPHLVTLYRRLCQAAARPAGELDSLDSSAQSTKRRGPDDVTSGAELHDAWRDTLATDRRRVSERPKHPETELENVRALLREQRSSAVARIAELEKRNAALSSQLEAIHASRFWRVASAYWRLARWYSSMT